jgi:hypothetical protein
MRGKIKLISRWRDLDSIGIAKTIFGLPHKYSNTNKARLTKICSTPDKK